MAEVIQQIVDRRGKPGRTESFVTFEVHVSNATIEVNWHLLDERGEKDLRKYAAAVEFESVSGVAKIAWKSIRDRDACITDHLQDERRRQRWLGVKRGVERMLKGEFPQFAHAYLHPSLTGRVGLTVIDGTRRMLAYLEIGRAEMPVIIFRAKARRE